MKNHTALLAVVIIGCSCACVAGEAPLSISELRANGAFGFPQKDSKVLCDQPILRFSVWNNDEYLFSQAVLWTDDDASLGKTEDNREIGDNSVFMLDLDADGKRTPNVDRDYMLNPWPRLSGMHYQIWLSARSTTGINSDSKGRGAVRYVELSDGRRVRVDTYLIPLSEISRKVGDKIRLCYWGYSPKPSLTVNSAGFERAGKNYYAFSIPLSEYHDYVLGKGGEIDVVSVPEDRTDISLSHPKSVKIPEVGEAAPEISAGAWINLKKPLTLASLRGKVVLVEFWATWCGPCVTCIPHLNELHRQYAGRNFELLSFVEEGHQTMDKFLTRTSVEYPIGLESGSLEDYGISSIPHAFLIDQNGKIIWHGNSASSEMDKAISTALSEAK